MPVQREEQMKGDGSKYEQRLWKVNDAEKDIVVLGRVGSQNW